jgi:hypothetical protein
MKYILTVLCILLMPLGCRDEGKSRQESLPSAAPPEATRAAHPPPDVVADAAGAAEVHLDSVAGAPEVAEEATVDVAPVRPLARMQDLTEEATVRMVQWAPTPAQVQEEDLAPLPLFAALLPSTGSAISSSQAGSILLLTPRDDGPSDQESARVEIHDRVLMIDGVPTGIGLFSPSSEELLDRYQLRGTSRPGTLRLEDAAFFLRAHAAAASSILLDEHMICTKGVQDALNELAPRRIAVTLLSDSAGSTAARCLQRLRADEVFVRVSWGDGDDNGFGGELGWGRTYDSWHETLLGIPGLRSLEVDSVRGVHLEPRGARLAPDQLELVHDRTDLADLTIKPPRERIQGRSKLVRGGDKVTTYWKELAATPEQVVQLATFIRRQDRLRRFKLDADLPDVARGDVLMEALAASPDLEALEFTQLPPLSDNGLAQFSQLKGLRSLKILEGRQQTPAGSPDSALLPSGRWDADALMAQLSDLPDIEEIHLTAASISATGLQALARCPKLRKLNLDDVLAMRTPKDGTALSWFIAVSGLRRLQELRLEFSFIFSDEESPPGIGGHPAYHPTRRCLVTGREGSSARVAQGIFLSASAAHEAGVLVPTGTDLAGLATLTTLRTIDTNLFATSPEANRLGELLHLQTIRLGRLVAVDEDSGYLPIHLVELLRDRTDFTDLRIWTGPEPVEPEHLNALTRLLGRQEGLRRFELTAIALPKGGDELLAEALASLPALQHLEFHQFVPEPTSEAKAFSGFPALHTVLVDKASVPCSLLEALSHAPRLKQLTLSEVTFESGSAADSVQMCFGALANFERLEELFLLRAPHPREEAPIIGLEVPPTLRHLYLNLPVDVDMARRLSQLPHLQRLVLARGALSVEGMKHLSSLRLLDALALSGTPTTPELLAVAPRFEGLVSLSFADCPALEIEKRSLRDSWGFERELTPLIPECLGRTPLVWEELEPLGAMTGLRVLDLGQGATLPVYLDRLRSVLRACEVRGATSLRQEQPDWGNNLMER